MYTCNYTSTSLRIPFVGEFCFRSLRKEKEEKLYIYIYIWVVKSEITKYLQYLVRDDNAERPNTKRQSRFGGWAKRR